MVSEVKFPEVSKLPISPDFQRYLESRKAPSKIDKIIKEMADFPETEHYRSSQLLAKLVGTVFSIRKILNPTDAAKHASNIASTIGDVLSFLSGAGAIASLVQNLKKKHVKKEDRTVRKLEIARSCILIISSVTSLLSILDRFKVIELANITKAMGNIPVIGQGLAQVFPASVVFSGFGIAASGITITISAIRLKQIAKRVHRIGEKMKTWKKEPIDGTFAQKKIDRIITKQEDSVLKGVLLKSQIEQMESALQTKGKNYEEKKETLEKLEAELATSNKVSRCLRTLKHKNALKSAKASYKKEIKKYKHISNEIKELEKTHNNRLEKGEKWEAIREKFKDGTITESDTAALKKMQTEKVAKWKAKRINERWLIAKEVTKIALLLISIAIAVTSIALIIIFTGNVPAAALISLAAIGLTLAAVQLMHRLYFNRIKKKPANSVEVPDFRTLRKVA